MGEIVTKDEEKTAVSADKKATTKRIPDKPMYFAKLSALWFFGGVYGFVYETIFYFFNSNMTTVYWRGGGFGPWLQIYGFGALLMYFLCYRFKKKPVLVFILSGVVCGVLELAAGYLLYGVLGMAPGWDYNKEILNFGNIGGYICLRSVLVFSLSGLFLVYVVFPAIQRISRKMSRKAFFILTFTLGGLFLADFIYNDIVKLIFPSFTYATELYESLGVPYMVF